MRKKKLSKDEMKALAKAKRHYLKLIAVTPFLTIWNYIGWCEIEPVHTAFNEVIKIVFKNHMMH